jgi:hypothetical protein
MYFSAGYRLNEEDEFAGLELISNGRKHAVILRVEQEEKYATMQEFMEDIHQKPVPARLNVFRKNLFSSLKSRKIIKFPVI